VKVRAFKRFQELYQKLPLEIQKKVDKQIRLLAGNPRHPSLQVKKRKGTKNIWYGRIDRNYRFTFEIEGDTIFLRAVGSHREVNMDAGR